MPPHYWIASLATTLAVSARRVAHHDQRMLDDLAFAALTAAFVIVIGVMPQQTGSGLI